MNITNLQNMGWPGKWLSTRKPLFTMYPCDRSCCWWYLQCFESSRERVLLWPAVCSLVAKACGRLLMLVCPQSQGGWCVFSLVLNAFLGLCLNNSFIYILKLNYTLSILLHVMQPSSTQIKHRYSEITFAFLTTPEDTVSLFS